ncbi:4'-phosphopantetheinyl transferase family protein [Actinokineospora inagensis]|uniref:4'-phosphopantetheinyl transferase family protein n=1 Tax=Actinokineospora inagensis TaxID=103730 RepID=UPI0003FFC58B|nr:4'-phosphopantetheinyl transferase superfamily protein [Actinokineospora inagensis]
MTAAGGSTVSVHVVSLRALDRVRGTATAELPDADRAEIAGRTRGARRTKAEAARVLSRAVGGTVNASHDRDFLVVAGSDATCGVDVEDAPEAELREVAARFCAARDRSRATRDGDLSARALWTAKESAAKAVRRGLRAGLRSIGFAGDVTAEWSSVDWPFGGGFLTRTVDLGDRHCALTVRADIAPAVTVRVWTPTVWTSGSAGDRWSFTPADDPATADPDAHRVAVALAAFGGRCG